MEDTIQVNSGLVTIPRSAFLIEKVHSCADCPIRRLAARRPSRSLPGCTRGTRPGGRDGRRISTGPAPWRPGQMLDPEDNGAGSTDSLNEAQHVNCWIGE